MHAVAVLGLPRGRNDNNLRQPKLGRNVCRRGISRQLFMVRLPAVPSAFLYEAADGTSVSVFTVLYMRHRYSCNL